MDFILCLVFCAIIYQWIFIQNKLGWFPNPFKTRDYKRKTQSRAKRSPFKRPKPKRFIRGRGHEFVRNYWGNEAPFGPRPCWDNNQVHGIPNNLQEMQTNGRDSPFRPIHPIPSFPAQTPEGNVVPTTNSQGQQERVIQGDCFFTGWGFRSEPNSQLGRRSELPNWRESPTHPSNRPRPQPSGPSDDEHLPPIGYDTAEGTCKRYQLVKGHCRQCLYDRTSEFKNPTTGMGSSSNGITNQKTPHYLDSEALGKEAREAIIKASKPIYGHGDNPELATNLEPTSVSGPSSGTHPDPGHSRPRYDNHIYENVDSDQESDYVIPESKQQPPSDDRK